MLVGLSFVTVPVFMFYAVLLVEDSPWYIMQCGTKWPYLPARRAILRASSQRGLCHFVPLNAKVGGQIFHVKICYSLVALCLTLQWLIRSKRRWFVKPLQSCCLLQKNKLQPKKRVYSDTFPGDVFVPLAIEVFGALEAEFERFISSCARKTTLKLYSGGPASDRPLSKVVTGYKQQLSVVLQRAQAVAMLQRSAAAVAINTSDYSIRLPWSYSLVASASRYAGERW